MKNTGITYTSAERSPVILPEMAELLPPLSEEQLSALEADLIQNGCYSPIIVNEDMVIIDGHTKQRTILHVRKRRRQGLYTALADAEALAPSKALYEEGLTGMEAEFERYMEAVALLEGSGIPRERLMEEKAEVYEQLAELNREIRSERRKLALCREIRQRVPAMEEDIRRTEEQRKEAREHERRRR